MDIHRQKLKPSYMAKRLENAARGHGHAGKRPNNPHGRPPKLTGLEDRPYFMIRPRETIMGVKRQADIAVSDDGNFKRLARYEFNRFMRQVIQRAFNNAIIAAGGVVTAPGRLDNRAFDRVYGPVFTVPTRFGSAFMQIIVEKHRLLVRVKHDLTDMPKEKTKARIQNKAEEWIAERYVADPYVTPYPKFWPVFAVLNGSKGEADRDWDGDVSRMVEPEAVFSKDRTGNAAFMYERFVEFLKWLNADRLTDLEALPKLPWRF